MNTESRSIDQISIADMDAIVKQRLSDPNTHNRDQFKSSQYRQAAVLIPLLYENDHWSLLFTRRTDTVIDHKGQVSFPGGAQEAQDDSDEDTALRETEEEIGLLSQNVRVLGKLPAFQTISSYQITPVVARIDLWPVDLRLSEAEVSRVFTIPVAWLASCDHWQEQIYRQHPVIFYQQFDGELLWGITASITQQFLRQMKWMMC